MGSQELGVGFEKQFYQVGVHQLVMEKAARVILGSWRKFKREKQSRKLRNAHKNHYLLFQAGSGKFLLQSLMQKTEGIFGVILEKVKPEKNAEKEERRKTIFFNKINNVSRSSRNTVSGYSSRLSR
jgi:hypothetical protein